VLPVALGLGAAVGIGLSNITAGIATRRLTPLIVGFWSLATGVLLSSLLLLLLRPPLAPGQIPGGLVAGLAGGMGTVLFYRAMAAGAISLVAPITACAIVVPVVYAIASGERLTPLAAAGIAVIIAGIVLASLRPAPALEGSALAGGSRRAVALALAAAAAYGAFFILIDLAPRAGGWGALWTAAAARYSGFGIQVTLALAAPRRLAWPGRTMPLILAAGTCDLTSLILINFGAMTEAYGIVTALAGLYPVVSVLLGVFLLGERLTRLQAAGATLAITGVVLVSV
jgi:drug/metabolite transporter (DMT)-like permease